MQEIELRIGRVLNIFTVRNSGCGKVMFPQACVKNSVHRGEVNTPLDIHTRTLLDSYQTHTPPGHLPNTHPSSWTPPPPDGHGHLKLINQLQRDSQSRRIACRRTERSQDSILPFTSNGHFNHFAGNGRRLRRRRLCESRCK